jgi:hypothetical protein
MATNVNLTPDLERFARACVDSGLAAAQAEADRVGTTDVETVVAEMDGVIARALHGARDIPEALTGGTTR